MFIIQQVFEVAPTFFMVDVQKAAGDAGEFLKVNSTSWMDIWYFLFQNILFAS